MSKIEFFCPTCRSVITFDSKYAGKNTRCQTCQQQFIIPYESFETPKKIKESELPEDPVPGFFTDILKSWNLFFHSESTTGIVFVTALTTFKFLISHLDYSTSLPTYRIQAPIGQISSIIIWGLLLYYYLETTYQTAFGTDYLPEIYLGGFFGTLAKIITSIWSFLLALIIVQLPCIIAIIILAQLSISLPIITYTLALIGLFFFPFAVLTIAVSRKYTFLIKPDFLVKPPIKAFGPYLLTTILFLLAWWLHFKTPDYEDAIQKGSFFVPLSLFINLIVQFISLCVMRILGLFFRHYSCYLSW